MGPGLDGNLCSIQEGVQHGLASEFAVAEQEFAGHLSPRECWHFLLPLGKEMMRCWLVAKLQRNADVQIQRFLLECEIGHCWENDDL